MIASNRLPFPRVRRSAGVTARFQRTEPVGDPPGRAAYASSRRTMAPIRMRQHRILVSSSSRHPPWMIMTGAPSRCLDVNARPRFTAILNTLEVAAETVPPAAAVKRRLLSAAGRRS